MNWALLIFSVATLARRCLCAYPQGPQYNHPQHQSSYQGPPVVPVILPGGFIADTEEVAKAKDLHFNAYAHAASAVKDSRYNAAEEEQSYSQPRYTQEAPRQPVYSVLQQDYNAPQQKQQDYNAPQQRQQDYNVPQHQYTGPVSRATYTEAKPVVNYRPTYSSQPRYQGPPAVPVILPNGYLADTTDVEAAKEHHFQLVAKAQAAVARAQERANTKTYGYTGAYARQEDDGSHYEEQEENYNQAYEPAPSTPAYSNPQRQPYRGPQAVPVVLPSGHIADTAEVSAAKISHLQQLLDAAQKSQPQHHYHNSR